MAGGGWDAPDTKENAAAFGFPALGLMTRTRRRTWLLIADRNFFSWADWCMAADSGAQLLWRVKADLALPSWTCWPTGRTPRY